MLRISFALLASVLMTGPSTCGSSSSTPITREPPAPAAPSCDAADKEALASSLKTICSKAPFPCLGLMPEYVAACQAGCMSNQCPKTITCTEVATYTASPCANCADLHDAIFWKNLMSLSDGCKSLVFDPANETATPAEEAQFQQCLQMTMAQKCAGLADGQWMTKIPW